MIDSFEETILQTVRRWDLCSGDLVIVAVSGGPDSLALIHSLVRSSPNSGLRFHVAHLDHGLRGSESEEDAQFVVNTCLELGLDFTIEKTDVREYRKTHRLSLEDAARQLRYSFLARVARENKARAIAMGHTSDDQVETVLMNIIRGTGLTGLRGIQEFSDREVDGFEISIIRPILQLPKSETEGYCDQLGLEPRYDSSNGSFDLLRNRLRHDILPALDNINPSVREAILRLVESAGRDLRYLEHVVDKVWDEVVEEYPNRIDIDRSGFAKLDVSIGAHLLRRAVNVARHTLSDLTLLHVDQMLEFLKGPAGRALPLPDGLTLSVGYRTATIGKIGLDICKFPALVGEHVLKVPGETRIGQWFVKISKSSDGYTNTIDGMNVEISAHAANQGLRLRTRLDGDRFQPLGMKGSKKLQDFMTDGKIDRWCRDRIPLVIGDCGIVWVVGSRIAEWAKPNLSVERLFLSASLGP